MAESNLPRVLRVPSWLYRLRNADGILLYVGVTCDLEARWRAHAAQSPWWPEVASKELEWYPTRQAARAAEDAAIAAEDPRHNKLGVPHLRLQMEYGPMADDPASVAARLSRRVAEVTHALMEAWTARDGSGPLMAAEVCEYDGEASSVVATSSALTQARRLGLASCCPGPDKRALWWATDHAWEMRRALDDRIARSVIRNLPSMR